MNLRRSSSVGFHMRWSVMHVLEQTECLVAVHKNKKRPPNSQSRNGRFVWMILYRRLPTMVKSRLNPNPMIMSAPLNESSCQLTLHWHAFLLWSSFKLHSMSNWFRAKAFKFVVDTTIWVDNDPNTYQEVPNRGHKRMPKCVANVAVEGAPVPQRRARVNFATRAIYNPNRRQLDSFRNSLIAMVGARPMPLYDRRQCLKITIRFYFKRPRSHFVSGGQILKNNAPRLPPPRWCR